MTKEEILKEIRRVALLNGAVPPGVDKFYSETGIKQHEWSGKYWVRWSDALKEAGFIPNQMQEGYREDFLIEKLIELIREIGRFPVFRELKIKAFKDKKFPSVTTFENRFGTKGELILKVIEYCKGRSEFEDVIRVCEAVSPRIKKEEDRISGVDSLVVGSVYLVRSGRFYKIGKTNSIGRREYEFGIQLPEKAQTIHTIRTDDPHGIEAYWHKRFESKRKGGEWFDLNASDIKAFKRWMRIL